MKNTYLVYRRYHNPGQVVVMAKDKTKAIAIVQREFGFCWGTKAILKRTGIILPLPNSIKNEKISKLQRFLILSQNIGQDCFTELKKDGLVFYGAGKIVTADMENKNEMVIKILSPYSFAGVPGPFVHRTSPEW